MSNQPLKAQTQRAELGIDQQPLGKLQWVKRETLKANTYNPNHVARPEMKLLKTSILEAGWIAPIVARTDGEIVDGYHRWLASADKEVAALTDGYVPVVFLNRSPSQQRMDTIRINRARGSHAVLSMARIAGELIEMGISETELQERLGMDEEEVERLLDNSGMTVRVGSKVDFGKSWKPDL